MALATKESQERDAKLNDHDNTYARTITSLEKRLDAKPDLMMQNLDEILSGSNRENRPAPMEGSRQAIDEIKKRILNLNTGRDPGRIGCPIGGMLTDNATSEIST